MKEIRVLLLNGSPRANGNTALALREMEKVFAQNGVQTETVLLGNQAIRGRLPGLRRVREAGTVRVRRCRQRAGPEA